jgi:DNA (cytosine-5)-methyltransferase 1
MRSQDKTNRGDQTGLRVLDLFCGAGGLSEGFRQAGYRIVGGIDIDRSSVLTFGRNHPSATVVEANISDVGGSQLAAIGHVDILVGGPSCQGFSTHGKRDQDDPRNRLFEEYLRIAEIVRPRWIVMENVRGMLTYENGKFLDLITSGLRRLGYAVDTRVLLAAAYGVPQLRERVIVMASRDFGTFQFPPAMLAEGEFVTVRDAISDLPRLGTGGGSRDLVPYPVAAQSAYQDYVRRDAEGFTEHHAKPVSHHALSLIKHISPGNGVRSLPPDLLPDRFKRMRTVSSGKLRNDCTTLYHRLDWDRPAYTITTYFRNPSSGPFVHPEDDRALTPREAARIQSFPDAYEFVGPGIPRLIGNAVPPLLGRAIAESIRWQERGVRRQLANEQLALPHVTTKRSA